MVKAAPVAPFVLVQTQLVLQFLVVTLNAPSDLGNPHQLTFRSCCRVTYRARTSSAPVRRAATRSTAIVARVGPWWVDPDEPRSAGWRQNVKTVSRWSLHRHVTLLQASWCSSCASLQNTLRLVSGGKLGAGLGAIRFAPGRCRCAWGVVHGAQTSVLVCTPTMYCKPSASTPARKSSPLSLFTLMEPPICGLMAPPRTLISPLQRG